MVAITVGDIRRQAAAARRGAGPGGKTIRPCGAVTHGKPERRGYDEPGECPSDPIDHVATLEKRAAELEAILDAAGSKRTVLFGVLAVLPTAPQEVERFVTGAVKRAEPDRVLASVLFTDIVGSTSLAAELGDRAWREVLGRHDALVDRVVREHRGRVVKHVGDGVLSAFDGPAAAIRCAEALRDGAEELGIQLRAGVHTGEVEAIGGDLGGLAVHIGARVAAFAGPGEIVVSSTVKQLVVGSDLQFTDRGEHELKGVPGVWRLYALGEERAAEPPVFDAAPDYMRGADRVVVTLVRRMPRAMCFAAQLATRRLSLR